MATDGDSPTDLALKRCDDQIRWYTRVVRNSRWYHNGSQAAAIILAGVTLVLVIVQAVLQEHQNIIMVLIALFPALAAIITGLNVTFQWKEDYVRFAYTLESLKSEKIKFCTRTTKNYSTELSDQHALDNFVRRIEHIALKETADWQSQVREAMELDEALKLVDAIRKAQQN